MGRKGWDLSNLLSGSAACSFKHSSHSPLLDACPLHPEVWHAVGGRRIENTLMLFFLIPDKVVELSGSTSWP
jgi:hypothetical protein